MSDERRTPEPGEIAGGRLLLGWILIVVGAVMLLAGWLGVSRSPQVAVQLTYLASGGLGGLLAGIVGIGLLVSDDIRRDRARIGRLEAAVLDMREMLAATLADREDPNADSPAANGSTAAPGDGTGPSPRARTRRVR